ncbi:S8 family peptidase [Cryptosporangium sp. NPDC051539]|uniref:S8 family peptidase n=1 Tax=Cryptosporangium sp. NPDC051539 TaxID=3363962 RepID=UPI0037A4951A
MTVPHTLYVDIVNRAVAESLIDAVAKDLTDSAVSPVDGTFGVAATESSPELGLTKLELSGVLTAASTVPGPAQGLTKALGLLEAKSRALYQGWTPEFHLEDDEGVYTSPHVKAIFDRVPEPLGALNVAPDIGTGGWNPPGHPRVGIADTLVYRHPVLAGHVVGDSTATFTDASPGHATFVAGIIRRQAPDALLVCHPVLGPGRHDAWSVAKSLLAFLDDDIDILNMSFGQITENSATPLRRALDRIGKRAVLVASGGNFGGVQATLYPAKFPDVVAVGSGTVTGDTFELATSTPNASWLDLVTQGENVVGPFLPGEVHFTEPERATKIYDALQPYARWSGSSFAAAYVSGELARRMAEHQISAFDALDQLLNGQAADIAPYRRLR